VLQRQGFRAIAPNLLVGRVRVAPRAPRRRRFAPACSRTDGVGDESVDERMPAQPSIVVISRSTVCASVMQDIVGIPSTCTVQAPQ
jgi:hypothetical protein